jgi:hypothetical protein
MSVTSQYFGFPLFEPFSGPCTVTNTVSPQDQPHTQQAIANILIVKRPNAEITVDLGKAIASNETTGLVANALVAANASLTSKIRVHGVRWMNVPYFWRNPAHHPPGSMLTCVSFDFHIETDTVCTDVDGTISSYMLFYLNGAGKLRATVDTPYFQFSGGWPFCSGPVHTALDTAMPQIREQVKAIVKKALKPAENVTFKDLYHLPGDGTKAPGFFSQNINLALALLPA